MLDLLALVQSCAPAVGEITMASIIQVESGGNPLAIGINADHPPAFTPPATAADATALARQWITAGYSIDLGIAQINSANLSWLGVSVDQMFDPCLNIQAGAVVLQSAYERAVAAGKREPLHAALSAYNTGDFSRGIQNGYVTRVLRASARYRAGSGDIIEPSTIPAQEVSQGTEVTGFMEFFGRSGSGSISPPPEETKGIHGP